MNTVYNVYHFTAIGMHVKGPVWPKAIFQLDVDLGRLNPPMASLGITIFVVSIPLEFLALSDYLISLIVLYSF